jgi:hypothetical protein
MKSKPVRQGVCSGRSMTTCDLSGKSVDFRTYMGGTTPSSDVDLELTTGTTGRRCLSIPPTRFASSASWNALLKSTVVSLALVSPLEIIVPYDACIARPSKS